MILTRNQIKRLPVVECTACKAPIRWAVTDRGARMPLDAEPAKRVILTSPPGSREPVVEVVDTFMPHHATCPNAEQFRRRAPAQGKD